MAGGERGAGPSAGCVESAAANAALRGAERARDKGSLGRSSGRLFCPRVSLFLPPVSPSGSGGCDPGECGRLGLAVRPDSPGAGPGGVGRGRERWGSASCSRPSAARAASCHRGAFPSPPCGLFSSTPLWIAHLSSPFSRSCRKSASSASN